MGRITGWGGAAAAAAVGLETGYARATSSITLTPSVQDVPGCSFSLSAGTWIVWGVFYGLCSVSDGTDTYIRGLLNVGGVAETSEARSRVSPTGGYASFFTFPQTWIITLASTTTVKLQALKPTTAGTHQVLATHTTIAALKVA